MYINCLTKLLCLSARFKVIIRYNDRREITHILIAEIPILLETILITVRRRSKLLRTKQFCNRKHILTHKIHSKSCCGTSTSNNTITNILQLYPQELKKNYKNYTRTSRNTISPGKKLQYKPERQHNACSSFANEIFRTDKSRAESD